MVKGKHRFSGPKYANGNYKSQQKAYMKTEKGKKIARDATNLNRTLGTYGNGDNLDASHDVNGKGKHGLRSEWFNRGHHQNKKNKKNKNKNKLYITT
tara:strand:- start:343 stop:633 length:291 start_codon:yes stop_codon:yes gene_type:complete